MQLAIKRLPLPILVLLIMILAASCANNPLASSTPAIPTEEEKVALCDVVSRGTQAVADAGAQGIGAVARTKVQYFDELETVVPEAWEDNLALFRPAWEKLVEVAELAGDDADNIDFERFLADFSDANANESAWEAYTSQVCNAAGQ